MFVDFLIDSKYLTGLESLDEKSNLLVKQLFEKEVLEKLALANPSGLKLLFMFSFKLN